MRRTPHHAFCQKVLFGCFANLSFAFCSCLFTFCLRPLSLSFLPLSPIAYLLFPCFLCLKSRCFYITRPFFLILRKSDYRQISPVMIFPCLLTSTGSVSILLTYGFLGSFSVLITLCSYGSDISRFQSSNGLSPLPLSGCHSLIRLGLDLLFVLIAICLCLLLRFNILRQFVPDPIRPYPFI